MKRFWTTRKRHYTNNNNNNNNNNNILLLLLLLLLLFCKRSACVVVHLPLLCNKHGLKHLFEMKHTELFCSCWFDLQYNIVADIDISFLRIKSNKHKICVLLILCFSGHRCHGNIDSLRNHIMSNSNVRPVTGANFISIRVWPNGNVRFGPKNCIEPP